MKKYLLLLSLVIPCASFAADAPAPAPDLTVSVQDCQAIMTYQQAPGTEYQPGVDVHGKPVVEADLNPAVVTPPEAYNFPLTVDMGKYMGLHVPKGLEGQAIMGTVTFAKGEARFNGAPLEGPAMATLKSLCAQQNQPQKPAENVQNPPK